MDLIETDCGSTVANLVSDRLGLLGSARSVREQARELTVTRARIYQLLDDCGKIMGVRWPEGSELLDRVADHFSKLPGDHQSLRLFFGLRELCFPSKQRDESDDNAGDVIEIQSNRSNGRASNGHASNERESNGDARHASGHYSSNGHGANGHGANSTPVDPSVPRDKLPADEAIGSQTAGSAGDQDALTPGSSVLTDHTTDREAILRPDGKSRPDANAPHVRAPRLDRVVAGEPAQTSIRIGTTD